MTDVRTRRLRELPRHTRLIQLDEPSPTGDKLGHIVCVDWADVAAVLDTEGDRQALKPEQQDGGPFTIEDIEARWSNVPTWHDGPAASKDIRWLIEQLRQAQLPGPTPLCVVCGKVA